MISTIKKYFPHLTEVQENQMEAMMRLYPEWNAKINVVSRKDIDNLEVNHLLHSLAIAKFIGFKSGSRVLDLGTGGGLPGKMDPPGGAVLFRASSCRNVSGSAFPSHRPNREEGDGGP